MSSRKSSRPCSRWAKLLRRTARPAAVAAALAALVAAGCGGPSYARRNYAPASPAKPAGQAEAPLGDERPYRILNTLPIRVHAEEAYRAAHVDWRSDFAARIRRANDVLAPRFGVELAIESLHEWDRSPAKTDLAEILLELESHDQGRDVIWVIGLVSALPAFTPSHDYLGTSRVFGKHLVLRGVDDPNELEAFLKMPKKAGEEDPGDIYYERVRHRETSTLLHELGHTLGAIHTRDPRSFMHAAWDQAETEFDAPNATLIEMSLRHLLLSRAKKDRPPDSLADVIQHIRTADARDWDPDARAQTLLTFERYRPPPPQSAPPPEPKRPALPEKDAEIYNQAIGLAQAGKAKEALDALEPLRKSRPEDPLVQSLACGLATGAQAASPSTHQICATAAKVDPNDARSELHLAHGLIEAGELDDARLALGYARQRLEKRGEDPDAWAYLAQLYPRISLFTFAEEAAARAGEHAKSTLAWIQRARRFHQLPQKAARFRIRPEDEPEYIAKATEARSRIDRGEIRAALVISEAGLKRFPDAPAFHTRICAAQIRLMNRAAAEKACRRAIASDPESPEPHFLLGVLASLTGRPKDAIQHLERAIALDPDAESPWRALAEQYRRSGNKKAVERLRVEFASRFKTPL